jgi:hypothetical protein
MASKSSSKVTRKTSSNQRPRGLATIVVIMVTILLIVPMSVGKKTMTRRRRKRAIRRTSITRRKPLVRHTLARSGTPMMRALTLIMMVWPP